MTDRNDIIAKATEVFGSLENAENWLRAPALGLNGEVPESLLSTEDGIETLYAFLAQLDRGVYI